MAYLALYRMFRPTTLNDVVRQEHIVTVLKNQIETDRIGHAYLFCGPRGTGKTSIAKIFAAAINCEQPVDGSPCGKCARCRALQDPSNLDITEIDAASNNGVGEMRDLREKVQYPPVAGKYKVFIVDEVHMLSTAAFNALLKTLEEPPKHAVFVLATTESQKIPATILSRCMRFDFKLIPQADLEERLRFVLDKIGKKYDEDAISVLARAGAGSVRDMLSIADTCVSYAKGKLTYEDVNTVLGNADFSEVAKLVEKVLQSDTGAAFAQTEQFLAAGKSVGMLLKNVLDFLNACAVVKTCRDGKDILALSDGMYAEVAAVAKGTDGHRLLRVTEIFARVDSELKYSASPRILFETAVLKASMPQEDYDIEALLARVAELERKLEQGDFVQNTGGRVATNAQPQMERTQAPIEKEPENFAREPREQDGQADEGWSVPTDMDAPPDESETGGYAYFDEPIPPKKPERQSAAVPVAPAKPADSEPVKPAPVAPPTGDAGATFGLFLRKLRKIARSGVLLTLCMDLDSEYDGGVLVLMTQSDTIYRALKKDEHYALIVQAFAEIGIAESGFDIRVKGKRSDSFHQGLNAIRETFDGVKVDVK